MKKNDEYIRVRLWLYILGLLGVLILWFSSLWLVGVVLFLALLYLLINKPCRDWPLSYLPWLVGWAFLLLLTYLLTCSTIGRLNKWAKDDTQERFADIVRWKKFAASEQASEKSANENAQPKEAASGRVYDIPATTKLFLGDQLNPFEIGCKPPAELPEALRGKLKTDEEAKGTWVKDKDRSQKLCNQLFDSALEDFFDRFYATESRIPLQPIGREKKLRRETDYEDLLSSIDSKDDDWLAPILCTRRCESRINRYRCVPGPV